MTEKWNNDIRVQLDNLVSFPPKLEWKLGAWTEECHVRPEVADFASLPLLDNQLGDVRVVLADQSWYVWDGAAWQSMGGGGGGAVNSVTASAPIASSGGANPNISLTGVVAVGNGGTGLSSITSGAVLFGNGTSPVGTDSGQLHWDAVNDRLGIGNGTPAETLSVGTSSEFRVDDTGNITRIHDVPYNWPNVPGGADTFLRNDGVGNLTWQTIAAGGVTSVAASSPLSISGPAATPTVDLTGIVPVANGGTGVSTVPAQGALPIGTGAGYSVTTLSAGSGISISNAPGAITISATGGTGTVTSVGLSTTLSGITVGGSPVNSSGTFTLGGTLAIASGGTGATNKTDAFDALAPTTTKGDLVVSNGTDNVRLPVGAAGNVLVADSGYPEGIVWSQVNLASTASVAGTLPVGNGGTGAVSFTANTVLLGNGTSALQTVAPGTSGNVLTSDGTTWQSTALPAALVSSVGGSGGTTGLTLTGGPTGAVTLTLGGTLSAANGGTGRSTLTSNNVLVGNGTSAVQLIAPGAVGDVLTWNGTTWLSAPPVGGGGGGVTSVTASAPILSSGGAFPNISLTAGTNPNDVLTWNGTSWVSSPPSGAGVASVTASSPLSSSGGVTPDISLTGVVGVANGGTGVSTVPSNGRLLIGNGTGYTVANLTAGTGISITNGAGTITINGNVGTVTSVDVSGGTTGLTTSGGPVTGSGTITLAGTLAVGNGGTGASSLTLNNVILGNGTSAVQTVAPGASGNVLTSNGTTWQSTALPAAPVSSVSGSGGTTGLTLTGGPTGVVTLTLGGTLAVANGGTGQTSYTNGQLLIGNSTGNTLTKATLTAGAGISITNGAGTITVSATGGTGTVTSVSGSGGTTGLTLSGGPITTTGTLTLGGTLIAANGGTGQSSYAVGDILYANTTSTLAKLPDTATGNALVSGGVGVAPSWGKIGLTTHVSGTLPIANGGTGQTSTPSNGQILVGNGTGFSLNTVTAGTGISITNGPGSVTVAATGGTVGPGTVGQVAYFDSTSSVTSESNTFTWDSVNNSLGINTANPTFPGTIYKLNVQGGDIRIREIRAGYGFSSNISSCAFGQNALGGADSDVLNFRNSAFGTHAGFSFSGVAEDNTAVGGFAMGGPVRMYGIRNTAVGSFSLYSLTLDTSNNVAVGYKSLYSFTGNEATAIGTNSLTSLTTGDYNTAVGFDAASSITTGSNVVALGRIAANSATVAGQLVVVGASAGTGITAGTVNLNSVAVGYNAEVGTSSTGQNTVVGASAGGTIITGTNVTCIGYNAEPTNAAISNEVTLGNASVTRLRCAVTSITAISDQRDKAEIQDLSLGLDFLTTIHPVQFKWDRRSWYENGVSDGSKKAENFEAGFIAQELDAAQTAANAEWMSLASKDNPDQYEATPMRLFPVMVKAMQELADKVKALEAEIAALKS